ncbi:dTMP kinase [Acetobacter pomorum]|uniref:Thymidylate kinase n=3 Tax=Acetobacter pomorum TaxID=65959 RepID=A0A2G4RAN9_9PROT|nr:dTMP kinase [Acetobacter pomorum]PHY93622.1 dTMP kinase [Acetobacter pomorum]
MACGMFITLEGAEGVGKSTQLRLLKENLEARGQKVLATREPGGSAGAEDLRQLLLFGKNPLSARAEILTHFAARYDHVDQVILPALKAGQIVLCDRFTDSTMAYQGYGRANGDPAILSLIETLQKQLGFQPDITFLLQAPRAISRQRLAARGAPTDRYERADEDFHARLADGFAHIAKAEPQRVRVVDTSVHSAEQVNAQILKVIQSRLAHARG